MNDTTFTARLMAADGHQAVTRVAERLPEGFKTTGHCSIISERHNIHEVTIVGDTHADRNDCWVVLTSYGITPNGLGSVWETVKGL